MKQHKPRIIYIHGNQSSHWSFGWAPWLKQELEARGYPTFFETFPDSIIARAKYWLPFLEEHIQAGENDILIGWSSGAVAAMRYAENHKILGSVLVSPCYTDTGNELERMSGYYDAPWKWDDIRKNQKNISLFYGDNDPYIPQKEFAFIADQLTPDVMRIRGAGHFIDYKEFSEVLQHILEKNA
ncbi:MAG: alpha/beta fold hydrolase [Patescibacteria group bacterium]